MTALQAKGIAAGTVRQPLDLGLDPHCVATGRFETLDRPFIGGHLQPRPAYVEGEATTGYPIRSPSPTGGQHNREVLQGELGLSDEDFDNLLSRGIIGFEARPRTPKPT